MSHPKVTVTEYKSKIQVPRSRNLSRVACVGTSTKGKYGEFILINGADPDDLKNQIGEDTKTGSVGMQAAIEEGATDCGFARVMGAARRAAATAVITGAGQGADTVTLQVQDGAGFDTTYTATITAASTANSVASDLVNAVNADAACPITAVVDGAAGSVVMTAKVAGADGNSINYTLTETSETPDEFAFTPAAGNLAGGANGPAIAKADKTSVGLAALNDLILEAPSEGTHGNNVTFQWIPDADDALKGELVLSDGDEIDETFTLQFKDGYLINGNEFAVTRTSKLVRAKFGGADIATPAVPTAVNGGLSGGGEGSAITTEDYLDALKVLEKNQANIIFAPGQTNASIRAALLAQAENATIREGLRVAVLNASRALDVAVTKDETDSYNTTTGSATMVMGWCTFSKQPSLPELSVSPDGFYAGHLAATPMYVSPCARSSSPFFKSVVDVDTPKNNDTALDTITDNRLEAIILDPDTGGFHCLNGRTLSSDSAEYYMCVRRMANKIKTLLYVASQPFKSEPKDDGLSSGAMGTADTILKDLKAAGEITSYGVKSSVRTAKGIRTDFSWGPKYPADEIEYGMYRDSVVA